MASCNVGFCMLYQGTPFCGFDLTLLSSCTLWAWLIAGMVQVSSAVKMQEKHAWLMLCRRQALGFRYGHREIPGEQ